MCKTITTCFLVLAGLAIAADAAWPGRRGGGSVPPPINTLTFGTPFQYDLNYYPTHTVNADGWGNTWADDDQIYIISTDTFTGWDQAVSGGRNLLLGKMTTYDTTGIGSNYNTMDAWGTLTQNTGSDNASHKVAGIISVQGTMYAWAWRIAGTGGTTGSAQLLKSTNHGAAWAPVPPSGALPYASPMFPGPRMPMGFIQYGKDYSGAGPDNSANYVYTMVIDNGATSTARADEWLGRCLISNATGHGIQNQNAADWTFWQGGDGMLDANWGPLSTAASLAHITVPNPGTGTGIYYWNVVWLPFYKQYLAINGGDVPVAMTWTPYVAPHPWGPWTALPATQYPSGSAHPLATFANPVTKSLAVDGGHTMFVYGSGDYTSTDPHTGLYTLWITPATVN